MSCTGCDGVARAGGGLLEEDSCGYCGGQDQTCALPPRVGLHPFPVDLVCQQLPSSKVVMAQVWWVAARNKSSADFLAVCPAGDCFLPHKDVFFHSTRSRRSRNGLPKKSKRRINIKNSPGAKGVTEWRAAPAPEGAPALCAMP